MSNKITVSFIFVIYMTLVLIVKFNLKGSPLGSVGIEEKILFQIIYRQYIAETAIFQSRNFQVRNKGFSYILIKPNL